MRAIDAAAPEPLDELIARAGAHVARHARSMLGGVYGRRVIAIAGPGNNGADARYAAQMLQGWGVHVEIVAPDVERLPRVDLVIDGAFGTGMNRPYRAPQVPDSVRILAVDIPSGIDGLTGEQLGAPLRATETVTFAALKPGLLLGSGPEFSGKVHVVEIGLETGVAGAAATAGAWLLTESDARESSPRRAHDTHKWKRAVYVIGGSAGMFGAPLLASRAALRAGCGLVWCGLPGQESPPVATEIVFRELPNDWHAAVLADAARFGALAIGCGLGRSPEVASGVLSLIDATSTPGATRVPGTVAVPGASDATSVAMVIDGDGLRALGELPRLRPNIVLTPHDGEYASLAGQPPGPNRFAAARSLAAATNATVLLKGPLTIVARPDGHCVATNTGDQRLATAGSGDVLTGIIGSYLAAGLDPAVAAGLGAWIHGEAAMSLSPVGMVASDLVDEIADVATRLVSATPHGETHAAY